MDTLTVEKEAAGNFLEASQILRNGLEAIMEDLKTAAAAFKEKSLLELEKNKAGTGSYEGGMLTSCRNECPVLF